MRVAMVANRFPKYSETFVVAKFLGLVEKGWDAHVICKTSDESAWRLFPQLADSPDHATRVHVARKPAEVARELGIDVIHFEFGYLARGLADVKEAGSNLVVSFRGTDLNAPKPKDADSYPEIWEHADALHVLSTDLWNRALRRGCPVDKPHAIIPPAVDATTFRPARRRYARSAGRPRRPLRILSVGRLVWHKGYEYALQAVAELERRGVRCDYRIIGDGEYRIPIDFAIDELGLRGAVSILGPLPRSSVLESMEWADLLLHPSLYEGFCNSVLEAQAMALPVVCTRIGGLLENVRADETALAVPTRNPGALADAIERLARDASLRKRLGLAGRERATSRFSVAGQIDAFSRLYRRVLPSDRARTPESARRATRERLTVRVAGAHKARAVPAGVGAREDAGARNGGATRTGAPALNDAASRATASVPGVVSILTPEGSTVVTISRGDEALATFSGREGWHFPRAECGSYAGHYPATGEEAAQHLEALRELGADFFVIPAPAFWWLEHYAPFTLHLLTRYRLIGWVRDTCVVFDLRATPDASGANAVAGLGLVLSGSRR